LLPTAICLLPTGAVRRFNIEPFPYRLYRLTEVQEGDLAEACIDSIGVFSGELRLEDDQQVNRGCSLRIKIDRQCEGKLSSLIRPAFRPDLAAVRLHDHFTDRQP
jgi:hypothetical protein